ncbi:VWA domain-containing protein [Candidatus Bathyarchaeota archaeon]|nr:MAG: VWA domain-containing protein [Candidatus Bathyarchaeota archaeon]
MSEVRINFPFSAIVDQERFKLALLLNAVNPSIGGLLVRGPKGSGKSMAVRALSDLLPEIEVVADCPFNCSPTDPSNMCSLCRERWRRGEKLPVEKRKMRVITLPLGSTEDRVVGTLDIERALREGVRALQPGILAEANQNILYVDEINLLPDHIVDDLLDAAASGWNVVERENISVAHPSRFILIGTMNPEEGELRPQLLDRLPMSVTLHTIQDVELRAEIVKRNLEFRRDPLAFIEKYRLRQEELRAKILRAKELLKRIEVSEPTIYLASAICSRLEVDGQRPDIIMVEVARTIAALEGRLDVKPEDVLEAAKLVLNHRTRRGGFLGPPSEREIEDAYRRALHIYEEVKARTITGNPKSEGRLEANSRGRKLPRKLRFGAEILPSQGSGGGEGDVSIWRVGNGRGRKVVKPRKVQDLILLRLFSYLNLILEALIVVILVLFGLYFQAEKPIYLGIIIFTFLLLHLTLLLKMKRKVLPVLQAVILFGIHVRDVGRRIKGFSEGVSLQVGFGERIRGRFKALPDVNVRGSMRSYLSGRRGISLTSLTRGRYRFYEKPKRIKGDIALLPTLQAAVISGHVNREGTPLIKVAPEDIRTKVRVYRAPVTVVLVLDVSGSMVRHLNVIAKAVKILNLEAYRKRDRLALVAFKEESAVVLNGPTTNINVVAGNIRRLKASGATPLADGLMKALEIVIHERRRNRDVIPLVTVISDFLPNIPLKGPGHLDPIADTLNVARLYKIYRVPLILITTLGWPSHIESLSAGGTALARKIAEISGGRFYLLPQSPERLGRLVSGVVSEVRENVASSLSLQMQPLQYSSPTPVK